MLIFGESEFDTKAIRELLIAICPALEGMVEARVRPPVMLRGVGVSALPSKVDEIVALIEVEKAVADVLCVFLHQDADAVDPAAESVAQMIEQLLRVAGHSIHAAVPAWETEAWLALWPDAFAAHRPTWRRLDVVVGRDTGLIRDAKEMVTRELRPQGGAAKTRDYRPSDAPGIAAKVKSLGLIDKPKAKSASFDRFRASAVACCHLVN